MMASNASKLRKQVMICIVQKERCFCRQTTICIETKYVDEYSSRLFTNKHDSDTMIGSHGSKPRAIFYKLFTKQFITLAYNDFPLNLLTCDFLQLRVYFFADNFTRCFTVQLVIYLFIYYLFAQAHTLRTIRQGLEQNSKAQTCTNSYPKITENPTQYKSKVKSK